MLDGRFGPGDNHKGQFILPQQTPLAVDEVQKQSPGLFVFPSPVGGLSHCTGYPSKKHRVHDQLAREILCHRGPTVIGRRHEELALQLGRRLHAQCGLLLKHLRQPASHLGVSLDRQQCHARQQERVRIIQGGSRLRNPALFEWPKADIAGSQ